MEQEREVAKDAGAQVSDAAAALAGGLAPSKEAALRAIREMLTEVAEDALRLGILDCIPLIAAADVAIDEALVGQR